MKILIINAILYTAESSHIQRQETIKDTMIYDLCLAFHEEGHTVELLAGEPWRPPQDESYPFRIIWGKCAFPHIFLPHRLPCVLETADIVREGNYDLIISSEVFSINTFLAYREARERVLAWHELSKHNALFKQIPSRIWYNVVAKRLMRNLRVVARSTEARTFISAYCPNTESVIIDHGVNLDKFQTSKERKKQFAVCSQLIKRKRIDGILRTFQQWILTNGGDTKLIIIGDGEEKDSLRMKSQKLGLTNHVVFMGHLQHKDMIPILADSQALLVNTEKDNNMVFIIEAIALGVPVLTTTVPLNASYILRERLGIAKDGWGVQELSEIVRNHDDYVKNCLRYRERLSTKERVKAFIQIAGSHFPERDKFSIK